MQILREIYEYEYCSINYLRLDQVIDFSVMKHLHMYKTSVDRYHAVNYLGNISVLFPYTDHSDIVRACM